jgi:hypothetical protein
MWLTSWLALGTLLLGVACATASGGSGDGEDGGGTPQADASGNEPDGSPDGATVDASPVDSGLPVLVDAGLPLCEGCALVGDACCGVARSCDVNEAATDTSCRAVVTQGMDTSTCTVDTDCAKGYTCVSGGTASSCVEYCTGDAQCAGTGGICAGSVPVPGGTAKTCSQDCDPFSATGCPSMWACRLRLTPAGDPENPVKTYSACTTAGAGGHNATCTTSNDCRAGFACTTINAGSRACRKYCDYDNDDPCTGITPLVQGCTGFEGDGLVLGGKEYGVCY